MNLNVFSILFVTASFFGFLSRVFRQSLLIGFMFAGILLGVFGFVVPGESLDAISKMGIMFLLFMLGLELKINEFLYFGKEFLILSVLQIVLSAIGAFILCNLLGFGLLVSIIFSVALSFSSTIIVAKLLTDSKKIFSLQGRLSIGILLVQDVVAIIFLTILPSLKNSFLMELSIIPLKIISLLLFFVFITKYVAPKLFSFVADYPENVFIISIGWMFLISMIVEKIFGLSIEMGGLIAGISLSAISQSTEIFSKVRPLKDFFLTIYFVILGVNLSQGIIYSVEFILPVLILCIYVVIGKNIILAFLLSKFGYKKKVIFETSLSLSQISEFSIILVGLSISYLDIDSKYIAMITLIAILSMIFSTQAYVSSEKIYQKLKRFYKMFENKVSDRNINPAIQTKENHVVLMGSDKSGEVIKEYLVEKKIDFIIVDFDPKVIERANKSEIDSMLGDVLDIDTLEHLGLDKAKVVLSTIPGYEENLMVLNYLNKNNPDCIIILTASSRNQAKNLYEIGADYVVVPDLVSGNHIVNIFRYSGMKKKYISDLGKKQFKHLSS